MKKSKREVKIKANLQIVSFAIQTLDLSYLSLVDIMVSATNATQPLKTKDVPSAKIKSQELSRSLRKKIDCFSMNGSLCLK